jgi:hypothetical protein
MARISKKAHEARVNRLCSKALVGHSVSIMDLGKVSTAAEKAIAEGKDDAGVLVDLAPVVKALHVDTR